MYSIPKNVKSRTKVMKIFFSKVAIYNVTKKRLHKVEIIVVLCKMPLISEMLTFIFRKTV